MQRVRDSWEDDGEEPVNNSNSQSINYARILRKPGSTQHSPAVAVSHNNNPQSSNQSAPVNVGSMKILRRDPKANQSNNQSNNQPSNADRSAEAALLQRQREYEEARAKIFGTSENNQSVNSSNGISNNQSYNSVTQPINPPNNRAKTRPTGGMITLPLTQPASTYSQSTNPSINPSVSQPITQTAYRPRPNRQSSPRAAEKYQTYQSTQTFNQYQSMNQPINQSINHVVNGASFYQPSPEAAIDTSVDRSLMSTFSPSIFTPGIPWSPKGR